MREGTRPPAHIRSDNGSEFIATAVQTWLGQIGVKTLYIAPGSPWENGYNESRPHTSLGWMTPVEYAAAAAAKAAE